MPGTEFAVASGKGGVGKTTTAINLGSMLASADHEVIVVDTDLGMANVEGYLDFELVGPTLHEVLAGEAGVKDGVYEAPGDIDVLPSSTDIHAFAQSQTANLQQVVAELRESYEYVLLDTGAGISYDTLLPLSLADGVLLVTTPDVAAVRDTAKTGELAGRVEGTVRGAVLTQRSNDILNADDVEGTLDTEVLTVVPQDEAVPMGIDAGRPLAAFAPNSPAAKAYRELADILTGATDTPELSGEPRPADSPAPSLADAEAELPQDDSAAEGSKTEFETDPVHDLIDERIVDAADQSDAAETSVEAKSDSPDAEAANPSAEPSESPTDEDDSDDFDTVLAEHAAEMEESTAEDSATDKSMVDEPVADESTMEESMAEESKDEGDGADEPAGDVISEAEPMRQVIPTDSDESSTEISSPEDGDWTTEEQDGHVDESEGTVDDEDSTAENAPDLPEEIVDAESDDIDAVPFQDDPVPSELNTLDDGDDEDEEKAGLFGRIGSLFR